MAITRAVKKSMRELLVEDKLLHEAATVAIDSCERIRFGFNGIYAYRAMLTKLRSFRRHDLRRHLKLMDKFPDMRDYWLSVLIRLDADQFHRHVMRCAALWDRMTVKHDITPDITFEVLIGYPDQDPGATQEQTNAILMVNAAMLLIMYKSTDFTDGVTELTNYSRVDQFGEHIWELHTVVPDVIDLALDHVNDIDHVVECIMKDRLLQPVALRYVLDGTLPTADNEATFLANALTAEICDGSVAALDRRVSADTRNILGYDQHRNDHARVVRWALTEIANASRAGDADALRLHSDLVPPLTDENSSRYCNALHRLVKALREAGYGNIMTLINSNVLDRVQGMTEALSIEAYDRDTALYRIPLSAGEIDRYEAVLITATALGSDAVSEYMSDYARVMNMVVEHGITNHTDLLATIEEILYHGVLADGLL